MELDPPYRHLWTGRSIYGYVWAAVGLGGLSVVFYMVFWQIPFALPNRWGWHDDEAWVATALVGLILSAPLMHAFDVKVKGRGFLYQHEASNALLQFDDATVSGILSVQSIRTAVTTFILTAIVGQIPKTNGHPQWSEISPFSYALGAAVCFVLLVSLVTTLVATLCLDYSIRFSWNATTRKLNKDGTPTITGQEEEDVKKTAESTKLHLRMKAKDLNEIGFYCLMWSLAALPALVGPYACLTAVLIVYTVTWAYYFFPKKTVRAQKSANPVSEPLAKAIANLISSATQQVAATDALRAAADAEQSAAKATRAAEDVAIAATTCQQAANEAKDAANRICEAAKIVKGDPTGK